MKIKIPICGECGCPHQEEHKHKYEEALTIDGVVKVCKCGKRKI